MAQMCNLKVPESVLAFIRVNESLLQENVDSKFPLDYWAREEATCNAT
jgi:hypothetical protein